MSMYEELQHAINTCYGFQPSLWYLEANPAFQDVDLVAQYTEFGVDTVLREAALNIIYYQFMGRNYPTYGQIEQEGKDFVVEFQKEFRTRAERFGFLFE